MNIKSKFNKFISLILAVSLILTMNYSGIGAAYAAKSDVIETNISADDGFGSSENENYVELKEKRDLSTKYYLLESKRFAVVLFGSPVHYLKNGEYEDIDNSLCLQTSRDGKSFYTNRANSFQAYFASTIDSGWMAGISQNGYEMKWMMRGLARGISGAQSTYLTQGEWASLSKGEQRAQLPNLSSQVNYANAMPGVTLDFQLVSDTIKESITINSYNGINTFSQVISLKGLDLIQKEDGAIFAVDSTDHSKVIFYLAKPFAIDSSYDENFNEDIKVTLEEANDSQISNTESEQTESEQTEDSEVNSATENTESLFTEATKTYILTYTLDAEYLKKATYPIIIDPSVKTSLTTSNILDSRINEVMHGTNYGNSYLTCTGYGATSRQNYALVNFANMPELESSCMITSAVFQMEKESTSSVSSYVSIHQITQQWNESTVTWDNFFSSTQTYDPEFQGQHWNPEVEDFNQVGTAAGVKYSWDVTQIVKKWYSGSPRYGLLLTDMGTSYKGWCTAESYGDEPSITIEYVDYSGLESYWDYATAGLDRSGAANVNLYNGNLVYTHTDISTTGNRMPVTIAHVFNSTNRNDNEEKMFYGKGWRTNYDQRIEFIDHTKPPYTSFTKDYYRYTDGDGTVHYFSKQSNKWKDESGLGYELTINNNIPTISDKQDNKIVFYAVNDANKPGFLNYIEDHNGNRQTVGYDGNHRINQVTDGAGRVILLTRDANNYLYKIREEVDEDTYRETTFTYSNQRLTRITYPDGNHTDFLYDSNGNIDRVTGVDGKRLDLDYQSSAPYRITHMEQSTATENGSELSFAYGYNQTQLTDSKGRTAVYQFNDRGNTVCIIGPDGSAAYAEFGTAGGDMGKILSASKTQKFGKNYILNHSMEVSSNWTFGKTETSATTAYATDNKYSGAKSIKIVKTTTSNSAYATQNVTLEAGETYTISGYIKTNTYRFSGGAAIKVGYYDSQGSIQYISTQLVTGTYDWERHYTTFTIPDNAISGTVVVCLEVANTSGTAWFDCIQLENGVIANRYNIIENADFDYQSSGIPNLWTRGSNCTSSDVVDTSADSTNPDYMSDNAFHFVGSPSKNKYIEQVLHLSGNKGDNYIVGGWCIGKSIPVRGTIKYGIAVRFDYIHQSDAWVYWNFNEDTDVWQYLCKKIVAEDDYQNLTIRIEINYNANEVEFDAIEVFKEGFDNQYEYYKAGQTGGNEGDLKKITYPDGKTETFTYDSKSNMLTHTNTAGKVSRYTYDAHNNLLTATTAAGVVTTYTYDAYGNLLYTKVGNSTNYIKATATYDTNGNYIDYMTDSFGKQVNCTYNPYTGLLSSVTDPLSNTVYSTYDSDTDQLTGVSLTSGGITVSNSYEYTDYRLTQLSHNAPNDGTVEYNIHYNSLGWNTGTSVGDQVISTSDLEEQTGRFNSVTYGNGDEINYTYDDYDRVILVSQDATALYGYAYDNRGLVGYMKDYVQNVEYRYEYDIMDRLLKTTKTDSTGLTSVSEHTYNTANEMSVFEEKIGLLNYTTSYTYDDDNRPETATFGTYSMAISYDSTLGLTGGYALKNNGTAFYNTSFSYYDGDGTTSTKSGRVQTVTNGGEALTYTYDDRGIIRKVEKDANNYSEYRYNALGELIRENYKWGGTSYTMIYTYDVGGNITSKTQYAFVTGDGQVGTPVYTIPYTYDATWQDKLASYDGTSITYDSIGNPLDDGTWEYTWTQGNNLQQITNGTTTASYIYNSAGIRTGKTVNGVTTEYNIVGDKITYTSKDGIPEMYFIYDSGGRLWSLVYNTNYGGDIGIISENFFYVRNAQGDIIKIVNSSGAVVVAYAYDAGGSPMGISGSMASTLGVDNPFRYRGYFYDEESGMYYLNARYYNPGWGRFVNADTYGGSVGGLLSHNIFAYCLNNPVMLSDPSGNIVSIGSGDPREEAKIRWIYRILGRLSEHQREVIQEYYLDESNLSNVRLNHNWMSINIGFGSSICIASPEFAQEQLNYMSTGVRVMGGLAAVIAIVGMFSGPGAVFFEPVAGLIGLGALLYGWNCENVERYGKISYAGNETYGVFLMSGSGVQGFVPYYPR